MWTGKIFFGTLGGMLLGPVGFIMGIAFGHQIDSARSKQHTYFNQQQWQGTNSLRVREVFFKINFAMMGHIAKADGVVTKQEIRRARNIMRTICANKAEVHEAMLAFYEGAAANFNMHHALNQLIKHCQHDRHLLDTFLQTQFNIASANGVISPEQEKLLEVIYSRLGFNHKKTRTSKQNSTNSIKSALHFLGLAEDATNVQVKRRYRKLMNKHHPDKLSAKGHSAEEIKKATEKTQSIKSAYEVIRKYRNFR